MGRVGKALHGGPHRPCSVTSIKGLNYCSTNLCAVCGTTSQIRKLAGGTEWLSHDVKREIQTCVASRNPCSGLLTIPQPSVILFMGISV